MPSWLSARNTTTQEAGQELPSLMEPVTGEAKLKGQREELATSSPSQRSSWHQARPGDLMFPKPCSLSQCDHVLILPGQLSCAINQVCSHVLRLRTALGKNICHKIKDLSHLLKISFQEFDLTLLETHTPNWSNSLVLFIFFFPFPFMASECAFSHTNGRKWGEFCNLLDSCWNDYWFFFSPPLTFS